jgi:transcription-repair coupling factor (superfamily II helicase)
VLTLTATPIPRTLAMSLEGPARLLGDRHRAAAAPRDQDLREPLSDGIVREAVLRELKRGGQAYYLYNEVETIENRKAELEALLPEARIAVAHGQMRERELESVMRDFYHQRSNVLLCSTIIETGIDVPTANTILIHRADKFGLAQLHQLRGRVGRLAPPGYAYLLTPPERRSREREEAPRGDPDDGRARRGLLPRDARPRDPRRGRGARRGPVGRHPRHRLHALQRDARPRREGLKRGKEPDLSRPLNVATEVNLHAPALLPETYCGDVHERLVLYKRLANCSTDEELERLTEELVDRFGPLPDPARVLLECHKPAHPGGAAGRAEDRRRRLGNRGAVHPEPPVEPRKCSALVQSTASTAAGPDRVRIEMKHDDLKLRSNEVRQFLRSWSDEPGSREPRAGGIVRDAMDSKAVMLDASGSASAACRRVERHYSGSRVTRSRAPTSASTKRSRR